MSKSLSVLSGAHMTLVPRIIELLKKQGQASVKVMIGGIIPDEDRPKLEELGVAGIFGPGTSTTEVIEYFEGAVAPAPAEG